jgi:hypothetical protein
MPVIIAVWEAENRRIVVPDQPGQKAKPCLQSNQSKKDWRCGSNSRVPA